MIYITGDTHGSVKQLSSKNFQEGKTLTKDDQVIIAGDFGLLWNNDPNKDKEEKWWREWLISKPWTTLFVNGNHENFMRLYGLSEVVKYGNVVGKYADGIYHLKRGNVYLIDGLKVFSFGGAVSIDRATRIAYKSWWPEEVPSFAEMNNAVKQLEFNDNNVDIIVTHDMPLSLFEKLYGFLLYPDVLKDPVKKFLDYVLENVRFKKWYFGHYHEDMVIDNFTMLYNEIVKYER